MTIADDNTGQDGQKYPRLGKVGRYRATPPTHEDGDWAPILLDSAGRVLLGAGAALLGTVGIDQTTPGTTNAVQEVPAATFAHTSKTTNAATAVQLAASQACREALVTAKPGNTGWVYVGGSTVSSASYGRRLGAGQSIVLAVSNPVFGEYIPTGVTIN